MSERSAKTIGINVGAELGAVTAARDGILRILEVPHIDNSTRVAALDAFKTICGVNGVTLQGCSVAQGTQGKNK